jgi:dihydrodipicolinate reductase
MHALAIFGVTGRMGQSIVRAVRETAAFTVSGAVASPESPRVGLDAS